MDVVESSGGEAETVTDLCTEPVTPCCAFPGPPPPGEAGDGYFCSWIYQDTERLGRTWAPLCWDRRQEREHAGWPFRERPIRYVSSAPRRNLKTFAPTLTATLRARAAAERHLPVRYGRRLARRSACREQKELSGALREDTLTSAAILSTAYSETAGTGEPGGSPLRGGGARARRPCACACCRLACVPGWRVRVRL